MKILTFQVLWKLTVFLLCDEELTFVEGLNTGAVTYDEICNYEGRIYSPNTALSIKDILNSLDNEFDLTLIVDKKVNIKPMVD